MQKIPVAIIGGGLSGLYILLEARKTLGERILSSPSLASTNTDIDTATGTTNNGDSFDLGPS